MGFDYGGGGEAVVQRSSGPRLYEVTRGGIDRHPRPGGACAVPFAESRPASEASSGVYYSRAQAAPPPNASTYVPRQWMSSTTTSTQVVKAPRPQPVATFTYDSGDYLEREAPLEEFTGMPVLLFGRRRSTQSVDTAVVESKPPAPPPPPPPQPSPVQVEWQYSEDFTRARLEAKRSDRDVSREEMLRGGTVVGERYVDRSEILASGNLLGDQGRPLSTIEPMPQPLAEARVIAREPELRWYEMPIGIPWDVGGSSFMSEDVTLLVNPRPEPYEQYQPALPDTNTLEHNPPIENVFPEGPNHDQWAHSQSAQVREEAPQQSSAPAPVEGQEHGVVDGWVPSEGRDWVTVSGLVPEHRAHDGYRMGGGLQYRESNAKQEEVRVDPRDGQPYSYEQMLIKYARAGYSEQEVQMYWRECGVTSNEVMFDPYAERAGPSFR